MSGAQGTCGNPYHGHFKNRMHLRLKDCTDWREPVASPQATSDDTCPDGSWAGPLATTPQAERPTVEAFQCMKCRAIFGTPRIVAGVSECPECSSDGIIKKARAVAPVETPPFSPTEYAKKHGIGRTVETPPVKHIHVCNAQSPAAHKVCVCFECGESYPSKRAQ